MHLFPPFFFLTLVHSIGVFSNPCPPYYWGIFLEFFLYKVKYLNGVLDEKLNLDGTHLFCAVCSENISAIFYPGKKHRKRKKMSFEVARYEL